MQSLDLSSSAQEPPRQGTNCEERYPSHADAEMIETGKKRQLIFDKYCLVSALYTQYFIPPATWGGGEPNPVFQIRNHEVKNLRRSH